MTLSKAMKRFQFLGRNSGRSDVKVVPRNPNVKRVSIPRSEFWSFGPRARTAMRWTDPSFNSSVGILVVRTGGSYKEPEVAVCCFNSSVGILVVRTLVHHYNHALRFVQFQFLGRNSGRSDLLIPPLLTSQN